MPSHSGQRSKKLLLHVHLQVSFLKNEKEFFSLPLTFLHVNDFHRLGKRVRV